ncbi:MAG: hypothetical protein WAL26_04325 [Mycobacterium sp.]
MSTYAITTQTDDNGTITPDGTVTVNTGDSIEFTITANPGYHTTDVLIDGEPIGATDTYTFTDIDADHTIQATFGQDQ